MKVFNLYYIIIIILATARLMGEQVVLQIFLKFLISWFLFNIGLLIYRTFF